MVTLDDLKQLCQQGESIAIEFKRELSEDVFANLSTSLAAFANTQGGWILVGVDDDRQPIGYPPRPRHEDRNRVSAEAKNCIPGVQVDFEGLTFGKLAFLVIKVTRSNTVHCDKSRKYPVRIGSEIQYLDPAGLYAKFQSLNPAPRSDILGMGWGDYLGPSSGRERLEVQPSPEPRRVSKPSAAELKLLLRAIQSDDPLVQAEGLEQLRRSSWEYHAWYDRRFFPRLMELLRTGDERRVTSVLQVLRSGIETEPGKKRRAVVDYFKEEVIGLCRSGPTQQSRLEALQLLKEAHVDEVVDIIVEWGMKLDDSAFKELPLPVVFSNLYHYGYGDRMRSRLLSELVASKSEATKGRTLAELKALREHGR